MVPSKFYFNFIDILRSPRIALSGKKIWTILTGNIIGYLFYWIISYLSLYLSQYNFFSSINKFGLYPHIFNCEPSTISILVYTLGLFIWIAFISIAFTSVSRITIEELNGNHLFSISDAWIFSLKHWKTTIFTPLTIIFIIFILSMIAILFSSINSIPYVGSIVFTSFFPVIFIGSVFIIYTALVLINSLIYNSAIIAAYEEDVMGTIFQSYSISWSQPWRVIIYNIIILILIIIGVEAFSWFCVNSYGLIYLFSNNTFISGENFNNYMSFSFKLVFPDYIIDNILYYRSNIINSDYNYLTTINNIFEKQKDAYGQISSVDLISNVLSSSFLFIILLSVISYCLSIFCVGQTISFLIFKKLTDDDDILYRFRKNRIIDDIDHIPDANLNTIN